MKSKMFGLLILISLLGSLAGAGPVLAQSPFPLEPTPIPPGPQGPSDAGPETGMRNLSQADVPNFDLPAQALTLGPSGLSFRYLETFGKSDIAYLADHAHLNYPWGLGSQGNNIWIGELWGHRALKYNNAGVFLQQIGTAGDPDLPDTTFFEITDAAADGTGNIWVVDGSNSHVAEFNSSGNFVKELGVVYQAGSDNSHFNYPVSIAFDSSGNMYVSDGTPWWTTDKGNQRIQVFNSAGSYLATIGVTGQAGSNNGHFHGPRHIAIYGNQLYVADAGNHRVQIFDITNPSAPVYSATLGLGVPGSNSTHFNEPSGVAVDTDYIYIADTNNNRVQVFNRISRTYVEKIGGTWGIANNQFENPSDVAVDASHKLYVADFVNDRVQQFTHTGPRFSYARTYGKTSLPYLTDAHHYNRPSGVAIGGDGSIYLTEDMGDRLVKLNASGVPLWTVGAAGVKEDWNLGNKRLDNPADVTLDSGGRVYVADTYHGRIQIYNSNGSYNSSIGSLGCPTGLNVAPNGYLYIVDNCDSTVKIFNASHSLVAKMGVSNHPGSDNAHFNSPQDVVVDSDGVIYVADGGNQRIQVFNSSRAYMRTMGVTGHCAGDFGHFCNPTHLAVDSANRLYVSDTGNDRVQVFDASGAYLTTIAGSWGRDNRNLRAPQGVAVDADGNVYVADWGNNRIQKFAPDVSNWSQSNINGFGHRWSTDAEVLTTFNGQLYAAESNNGARVWRTSNGKTWSTLGTIGFGDAHNVALAQMAVFNGKLYAGTWNCTNSACTTSNGGQVWRSDGTTWSKVVNGGFGSTNNFAVNAFGVFSNRIYAATSTYDGKMQMYRSSTGNLGSWTKVVGGGFGSSGMWKDVTMAVYKGYLYVGLGRNPWDGELWRCHSCDGTDWSPVFTHSLGNPNNAAVRSLAVFNGALYVGLLNTAQGGEVWKSTNGTHFTKVFRKGLGFISDGRPDGLYAINGSMYVVFSNPAKGDQVWITHDGINWKQVGFAGWGDGNNTYADYMNKGAADFRGRLYIGTYNWANGGEIWSTPIP